MKELAHAFHFRHFSLNHHHSTMKVGTDAVLLGSWVNVDSVNTILDLGTGCGVLSLMMAQRTDADIDAVEIDELSATEAAHNFEVSQWNKRLRVFCSDIRLYASQTNIRYDLIVSNPPFFNASFKTSDQRRNLARHNESLKFDELCQSALDILQVQGRLAIVLPFNEGIAFQKIASAMGLYVTRSLKIVPVMGRVPNRINMELSRLKPAGDIQVEVLVIRDQHLQLTDAYQEMVKDFYLG